MTVTTCDICGVKIPLGAHATANNIEGKASLIELGSKIGLDTVVRDFRFKLEVETFQFNCTDFALCKQCLINAVSAAVCDMVQAERAMPVSTPTPRQMP
jgi:hypothetical protein